jgi:endonuclease YncB( thermonuclease family)
MLKFAAVVWLLVHAIGVNAAQFTGRVVAVLDGDTIVVLATDRQRVRVRLAGIDAPEKGQPFANRAKAHLSHLVHARDVVVDWHKRDPYGRVVGKVRVSGVDAALEMVTSGLAWHYARFANEQSPADRKLYAQAQARAREERRGLWRDRDPRPPWSFRHSHGRGVERRALEGTTPPAVGRPATARAALVRALRPQRQSAAAPVKS